MASASTGPSEYSDPAFVCPLCGTSFYSDRQSCSNCGGNLVVPIDDGTVYETILPLCGRYRDV